MINSIDYTVKDMIQIRQILYHQNQWKTWQVLIKQIIFL